MLTLTIWSQHWKLTFYSAPAVLPGLPLVSWQSCGLGPQGRAASVSLKSLNPWHVADFLRSLWCWPLFGSVMNRCNEQREEGEVLWCKAACTAFIFRIGQSKCAFCFNASPNEEEIQFSKTSGTTCTTVSHLVRFEASFTPPCKTHIWHI